eukprot:TRINITY_DN645_c3_g1_i1.p1 TRINITY_DN645_c3_g1~~TRINITY_DN645_c3_g1_i1.p1  ORF type:complete len:780 (-),score=200.04 TRINITY_DN645_c3_g1_i1:771-3110(-)
MAASQAEEDVQQQQQQPQPQPPEVSCALVAAPTAVDDDGRFAAVHARLAEWVAVQLSAYMRTVMTDMAELQRKQEASAYELGALDHTCTELKRQFGSLLDRLFAPERVKHDQLRRAAHRMSVVEELLNTERNYLADLALLVNVWQIEVAKIGVLTQQEFNLVFDQIAPLVPLSSELVEDLEQVITLPPAEQLIGQCFLKRMNLFRLYIEYTSRQADSTEIIANAKKDKKMATLFEKVAEKPEMKKLILDDFLIKPAQRITKYPLLLKDLIHDTEPEHPDYPLLQKAQTELQQVLVDINTEAKTRQTLQLLNKLQPNLMWKKDAYDLVASRSQLLVEGEMEVAVVCGDTTEKGDQVFMFDNCLLACKSKAGKWEELATFPLLETSLSIDPDANPPTITFRHVAPPPPPSMGTSSPTVPPAVLTPPPPPPPPLLPSSSSCPTLPGDELPLLSPPAAAALAAAAAAIAAAAAAADESSIVITAPHALECKHWNTVYREAIASASITPKKLVVVGAETTTRSHLTKQRSRRIMRRTECADADSEKEDPSFAWSENPFGPGTTLFANACTLMADYSRSALNPFNPAYSQHMEDLRVTPPLQPLVACASCGAEVTPRRFCPRCGVKMALGRKQRPPSPCPQTDGTRASSPRPSQSPRGHSPSSPALPLPPVSFTKLAAEPSPPPIHAAVSSPFAFRECGSPQPSDTQPTQLPPSVLDCDPGSVVLHQARFFNSKMETPHTSTPPVVTKPRRSASDAHTRQFKCRSCGADIVPKGLICPVCKNTFI